MTRPLLIAATAMLLPLGACTGDGYGDGYGGRPGYASNNDGYYLGDNDQIYRNNDGGYYCKRKDGSTGVIVGGLAGGVLGNVIAPGGSKTLGTLLGAGAGALIGREVDRKNVRCR
ncbi:glycine zipper 2TM domain-containing protein [Sphingobium sufflavum]|uniref:glycine zipper 2TM domain-containing protein n=1 Tax=Sphingobium sufflavum TaxID=1129547 RepID=UPI001F17F42F|nr:glycine zipper 2TM domain-containing protein [Sphingobium sufflavum]MCE7795305.1 glycine zipper 2TM domain-containing protein [Sphingobium sufflavum]